jgi:hypothetical protein
MSYKKPLPEKSQFSDIRSVGIADVFIAVIIIGGILAALPLLKSGLPDSVVVFRENSLIAEYPLDNNINFTVNGKNGAVGIEVINKEVKIAHVNCPHQICRRAGSISQTYGQLVCAPNNILIEIRSAKQAKSKNVDGVTH